jgi:hypothetical protein
MSVGRRYAEQGRPRNARLRPKETEDFDPDNKGEEGKRFPACAGGSQQNKHLSP